MKRRQYVIGMGIFNQNNNNNVSLSPEGTAYIRYKSARSMILSVLLFSFVNIVLLALRTNFYFLFSARIPLEIAAFGLEEDMTVYHYEFAIYALFLVLPYLLFWIFSKRNYGFMVAGLVYFSLDTLLLLVVAVLYNEFVSLVIDIAFHAYVTYYFVIGVKDGAKLKKFTNGAMLAVDVGEFMNNNVEGEEQAESEEYTDDNEN